MFFKKINFANFLLNVMLLTFESEKGFNFTTFYCYPFDITAKAVSINPAKTGD